MEEEARDGGEDEKNLKLGKAMQGEEEGVGEEEEEVVEEEEE